MKKLVALPVVASLVLASCATVPTGPSVMVIPGSGKSFEEFQTDDAICRQWAVQQSGTPNQAAAQSTAGAAIGAAAGSPATGAAVGAGAGLLGGTMIGAGNSYASSGSAQRRYDVTYMQCMYTKGNQIPVARGSQPARSAPLPPPPPPPPASNQLPPGIPPPPAGSPPPPPPGPTQ